MSLEKECAVRIRYLQEQLKLLDLDGALFIYPIDIYYLTGTRHPAAFDSLDSLPGRSVTVSAEKLFPGDAGSLYR